MYINDVFVVEKSDAAYNWNNDAGLQNLLEGIYKLRADAKDNTGIIASTAITVTVGDLSNQIHSEKKWLQETQLGINYPNPFNPEITIPYQLSNLTHVKVFINNALGQRVATLFNGMQFPGFYSVKWDATNNDGQKVASGIYLYRLETNESVQMKKLILI